MRKLQQKDLGTVSISLNFLNFILINLLGFLSCSCSGPSPVFLGKLHQQRRALNCEVTVAQMYFTLRFKRCTTFTCWQQSLHKVLFSLQGVERNGRMWQVKNPSSVSGVLGGDFLWLTFFIFLIVLYKLFPFQCFIQFVWQCIPTRRALLYDDNSSIIQGPHSHSRKGAKKL